LGPAIGEPTMAPAAPCRSRSPVVQTIPRRSRCICICSFDALVQEGSSSFLKKRTKKLLLVIAWDQALAPEQLP
jgi:hypothetical protein